MFHISTNKYTDFDELLKISTFRQIHYTALIQRNGTRLINIVMGERMACSIQYKDMSKSHVLDASISTWQPWAGAIKKIQ